MSGEKRQGLSGTGTTYMVCGACQQLCGWDSKGTTCCRSSTLWTYDEAQWHARNRRRAAQQKPLDDARKMDEWREKLRAQG